LIFLKVITSVFVLFLVVWPKLPGLWIFLKVINTRPRLADQGWSGPRFFITFKKIHNPGNFGLFVLFLRVRPKVARIMDFLKSYNFRFYIVFSCVAKVARIMDFLKSYKNEAPAG